MTTSAVAVIDELVDKCAERELPAPPEVLGLLRERLAEDLYTLVVCGDAKHGKSTLINALLGTPLLPTDVDVATSEVFRVRSADREGFRLRFDDGTSQAINRDDLFVYGSQQAADAGDRPDGTRRDLRWIEAEVPAAFLPERVAVLDTPRYGSLYAAHAQITRRFLPHADAVVFVVDTGQPLNRAALDLLDAIVEITPRVFFVQTKIDQHGREVWQQVRQRNEEILAEHFGERLPNARVWPVSGLNLMAARGGAGSDALLLVSRYPDLAAALRGFLDEMCAAPRAAEALTVAARHYVHGEGVLQNRLKNLTDATGADHREFIAAKQREFAEEWGENGRQRTELTAGIQRVTALARQSFREALAPSGPVSRAAQERIDAVASVQQANELGPQISVLVAAAAVDEWNRATRIAGERYAAILGTFLSAVDSEPADGPAAAAAFVAVEDQMFEKVRASYLYAMPINAVALIAVSIVASPLTIALAAGTAIWGLSRGWRLTGEARTKAAKLQLEQHLRSVLQQVQAHYFAVELSDGRFGRADEYFSELEGRLNAQVADIARKRIGELRAEIARLEDQAHLRASERAAAERGLRVALTDWADLGRRIVALLNEITGPTTGPGPSRATG